MQRFVVAKAIIDESSCVWIYIRFIDKVEIKKSESLQLENKRLTFFLLGILVTLAVVFVGLQYNSSSVDVSLQEDLFEDLSQELSMSTPQDQKDMVSAESAASPASQAITQEIKEARQTERKQTKNAATTSELVIGDGQGAVQESTVKEAVPETVVDTSNSDALNESPMKFTVVQKIPEFPGGWSAFMQWLTKNLKYPQQAISNRIQGMVVVSFIVNKDGSIADVKISSSADPLLDREALRVLRMMPKWKPGMDKNKVCRTMIAVPVVFKL